jgi:uncharacterized membrane protein
MSTPSDGQPAGRRHTAGAYDVRIVIAGLIGLYGLVLTVLGIVDYSDADKAKTGDVNANLWAGIAMLAFALAFALWARLRPVVVDPAAVADDTDTPRH